MDAERRGHRIDGTPWEEPRPPHLPDRLTSISPWALPFLVVAVYQLLRLWANLPHEIFVANIESLFGARYEFVGIAGSLLGLALFLRHPEARSTHPRLATGALLLLAQQVMVILTPILDPLLVAFSRPFVSFGSMLDDPHVRYSPFAQAYRIVITIVGIVGLAYLASGLSAARRNEKPAGTRGVAVILAILVVVASGASCLGSPSWRSIPRRS